MARFRLTTAHHVLNRRLKAGSTVADTVANALPGDFVWTGLIAAVVSNGMVAIDASAITMMQASRYPIATVIIPDGANSIDA